ncbi:MAG: Snf7 family protein [Candidatus Nitrosotenuis sp.]
MGSLSDKWSDVGRSDNLSQKILDKVRPDVPLKNKIDVAQKNLQLQIVKLDSIAAKIKQKNDYIFSKIVSAQKSNNHLHARAYATELLEIRKMHNMVTSAKLALEQIQLRLNTVSELGDIVVTLSPCMSVINGLSNSLRGIMPEATSSMQNLSQILGDVLNGSSMSGTDMITTHTTSSDTLAILEEAAAVIEGQTRASIPEPPSGLPAGILQKRESVI